MDNQHHDQHAAVDTTTVRQRIVTTTREEEGSSNEPAGNTLLSIRLVAMDSTRNVTINETTTLREIQQLE